MTAGKDNDNGNGWNEYSKLVLSELKRLNDCYESLAEEMKNMTVEIAKLQVKSGLWGAIGGMVPTAIAIIWVILKG